MFVGALRVLGEGVAWGGTQPAYLAPAVQWAAHSQPCVAAPLPLQPSIWQLSSPPNAPVLQVPGDARRSVLVDLLTVYGEGGKAIVFTQVRGRAHGSSGSVFAVAGACLQ